MRRVDCHGRAGDARDVGGGQIGGCEPTEIVVDDRGRPYWGLVTS